MMVLLAQAVHYQTRSNANSAAPFFILLVGLCVVIVINVAISSVFAWLISDSLSKVPVEFRKNITPAQVWLMIIPLFNVVWSFFVFQRIPDTFKAYFESNGRPQPGDYGKQLGLVFSIVFCLAYIPCVWYLAGPASLVLIIILTVKFVGYKNLIISGGGMGFPVNPPNQPPQM